MVVALIRQTGRLGICVAIVSGLLVTSASARVAVVRDWKNAMYYPARVVAVDWPNGRLSANRGIRFGAWTIRFGRPLKYALYFKAGQETVIAIGTATSKWAASSWPNEFICSNGVNGKTPCNFWFRLTSGPCDLYVPSFLPDGRYDALHSTFIPLPCPTALELDQ